MLCIDDNFKSINRNHTVEKNPKTLKLYPKTCYVNEKF